MFRKIFGSALLAGLIAGVVASALQHAFVVPVLIEAEAYESGDVVHFGGVAPVADAQSHGDSDHAHAVAAADGAGADWERFAFTTLATVVTFSGFGLLLVAGFALAERAGVAPRAAVVGVLWGLAGFAAVQLAPAMGLAPELPGSAGAEMGARQIWWIGTVAATAIGLALAALSRSHALALAGIALVAAPHVIGAPHPDAFAGVAPPELSSLFAARSLGVGAIAWAVLGGLAGMFWTRHAQDERHGGATA
jgi:cobalt transporter subunit CbtA